MSESKNIVRSGLWVASGTLVSRLLGFAKAVLLVYAIGVTGLAANSFATAMRIPNTVYTLIITGALTAVLVPQITKAALAKDGGQKYINKLVTLAMVGTFAVLPVIAVATPWFINVLGSGWEDPAQTQLAILFAWFLIPQIFFFSLYTVVGEVLNAKKFFGPYAWTPALNNVVGLVGLGIFVALYGSDATGMLSLKRWDIYAVLLVAGSSTLGVALQGLVLFYFWKKVDLKFSFDFKFRGVGLGTIGRVSFWTLLTVLTAQVVALVYSTVLNYANEPGVPSLAAWDLVQLISVMPHAVIVISIVTVNFTRMSESVHQGDIGQMKKYLSQALKTTSFFMVLITAIFTLLAVPMFRILQPTVPHSMLLAMQPLAVIIFLVVLPFSLVYVLQRGFFSLSNTRTPFFVMAFVSVISLAAALYIRSFAPEKIAYSLASVDFVIELIYFTALFILLRKHIGELGAKDIFSGILQNLFAGAVTFGVGHLFFQLFGGNKDGEFATASFGSAFITVAAVSLVMLITYLSILTIMKNSEAKDFLKTVLRK